MIPPDSPSTHTKRNKKVLSHLLANSIPMYHRTTVANIVHMNAEEPNEVLCGLNGPLSSDCR